MKLFKLSVILICLSHFSFCQKPEIEWYDGKISWESKPNYVKFKDSIHQIYRPYHHAVNRDIFNEASIHFYELTENNVLSSNTETFHFRSSEILSIEDRNFLLLEQFEGKLNGYRRFSLVPTDVNGSPKISDKKEFFSFESKYDHAPYNVIQSDEYFLLFREPVFMITTKKTTLQLYLFRKSDQKLVYNVEITMPDKHKFIRYNNCFLSNTGEVYLTYFQNVVDVYNNKEPEDLIIQKINKKGEIKNIHHTLGDNEFVNDISARETNGVVSFDAVVRDKVDQNEYIKFINYRSNEDFTKLEELSHFNLSFDDQFKDLNEEMRNELKELANDGKDHHIFRRHKLPNDVIELPDNGNLTFYRSYGNNSRGNKIIIGFYILKKSPQDMIEWVRFYPYESSLIPGNSGEVLPNLIVDVDLNMYIFMNDFRDYYSPSGDFKSFYSIYNENDVHFYNGARSPALMTLNPDGDIIGRKLLPGFNEEEFIIPSRVKVLNKNKFLILRARRKTKNMSFYADDFQIGIGQITNTTLLMGE